jgi:hypothetical protein
VKLTKETLGSLTPDELLSVVGGIPPTTWVSYPTIPLRVCLSDYTTG